MQKERKKFKNQKHPNRLSKKKRNFSLMRSSIVVIVILKKIERHEKWSISNNLRDGIVSWFNW
jgi:hypothetical protein